jgi:hypothetical protein
MGLKDELSDEAQERRKAGNFEMNYESFIANPSSMLSRGIDAEEKTSAI